MAGAEEKRAIVLHEVGLRDGLQMEREVVPTGQKARWVRELAATGLDVVQVGSFVHPEKVPQMADTDRLFGELGTLEGVVLSALVLNERGLERGLACDVELFCMGVSASETHSRKNTGMSVAEATARIIAMARAATAAGRQVQVSVQSAFGCGYEGVVPERRVLDLVHRFLDAGLTRVSLADTAGHAVPDQVERLYAAVFDAGPGVEVACHFHNTYGLALANCWAALRAGVTWFESSVAGLGGCPFTKVAGGNTCTEDFVHLLQRSGRRPDVRLDRLIAVAGEVAGFFGRDLPGSVYRTGTIADAIAARA
ncbi:MAG TPA: hydroxymethylglutaryl-CoA lyase [Gemmatimonadales bacterium]|nr:hydroxymethylglutaryl-CoA lyase [Gemmatimonadales bacterium]